MFWLASILVAEQRDVRGAALLVASLNHFSLISDELALSELKGKASFYFR